MKTLTYEEVAVAVGALFPIFNGRQGPVDPVDPVFPTSPDLRWPVFGQLPKSVSGQLRVQPACFKTSYSPSAR